MTSSPSRCGGAQRVIAVVPLVAVAISSSVLIVPAPAQTGPQGKYVISVGTPSEKLGSGTLWLYSYSWYGLQLYKLADIQNGLAVVPLDIDRLKREADPHPNTSAYVVVIQAGEHLWFRTPDIPPDRFWTDLPGAVHLLGSTQELPTGETQLVLPAPARRHVTLLYTDGRPKPNLDLTLSIYLYDENHCGFHEGLPLGNFRTDAKGTIEILAPLLPLHIDGLRYFVYGGTGPAGPAYSRNLGMKIPADQTVVIKVAWEVPQFTVQLQLLTPAGQPRPDVNVYGNWSTNICGGADRLARTDARGIVELDLDATFTGLTLIIGGPYSAADPEGDKNTRELTDAELRELFSKHKLTVRW